MRSRWPRHEGVGSGGKSVTFAFLSCRYQRADVDDLQGSRGPFPKYLADVRTLSRQRQPVAALAVERIPERAEKVGEEQVDEHDCRPDDHGGLHVIVGAPMVYHHWLARKSAVVVHGLQQYLL